MFDYFYTSRETLQKSITGEIKFVTKAKGGNSYAVEKLPISAFSELKIGSTIRFSIGEAKCHPEDNFCKKTGRELAEQKAEYQVFKVVRIILTEGRADIELQSDKFSVELFVKEGKSFGRLEWVGRL